MQDAFSTPSRENREAIKWVQVHGNLMEFDGFLTVKTHSILCFVTGEAEEWR